MFHSFNAFLSLSQSEDAKLLFRAGPKFLNPVCAARARCALPTCNFTVDEHARFSACHTAGTVPSRGTTTSKMIDRSPFRYRYEKLTFIGAQTDQNWSAERRFVCHARHPRYCNSFLSHNIDRKRAIRQIVIIL